MNGLRQGRVESPANVTAAYRPLPVTSLLMEQVAYASIIEATNKDSQRASGIRKRSGRKEKKSADKTVKKCLNYES